MTLCLLFVATLMLQTLAQSDGKGEKLYAKNALLL